jgi:hypothetical protein
MLHCTFVLHFRCRRCSDQHGQWIPFTVVIVTYFEQGITYLKSLQKIKSYTVSKTLTVDQNLSIL